MKISKQTTKVIQKSIKSTMQFTAFTIPATDDTNAMNVPKTPNNWIVFFALDSFPFPHLLWPYLISFNGRWGFYSAWMFSLLSHRIFLIFISSRSSLRSFMKNKILRHDRRKLIASSFIGPAFKRVIIAKEASVLPF